MELNGSSLKTNNSVNNHHLLSNEYCVSMSGFCFYKWNRFQDTNIEENSTWLDFERSTLETLDLHTQRLGLGEINSTTGAGGRVVIGSKQLLLRNGSTIEANSFQNNVKCGDAASSCSDQEEGPLGICFLLTFFLLFFVFLL